MSSALTLRQERAGLVSEMRKYLDGSPASKNRWKELDEKQEQLRAQIEAVERRNEVGRLEDEMSYVDRRAAQLPNIPGTEDPESGSPEARKMAFLGTREYREKFNNFLYTGERGEVRTYGALSPTGSVLIPIGFQKEVEVYLKAIGGLRQCARILTTPTGQPLQWPTEQDTSNSGHWLAPGGGVSQTNPAFANITLGADLLSSDQVLVDVELMQDSAFNMEQLLAETFGVRLARGTAMAYMNGNTQDIVGLLPALVAAGGRGVLAQGAGFNSGGTGTGNTGGTSLGTEDWSNVITAVDPAYRIGKNVGFIANQSTFDTMRNVLDKYGRPIWQVSLAEGQPDRILGYPYWFDQSMPLIGVNNTPVIFGNFAHYIIRDVLNMTLVRYNELYMVNHQIGFEAFLRTFGQLLNSLAFAYILNASS